MAEYEVEWLTPEILQELLKDFEDEDLDVEKMPSTSRKTLKTTPRPANMQQIMEGVLDEINPMTLSVFGEQMVRNWVMEFEESKNRENIITNYGKYCLKAESFFQHPSGNLVIAIDPPNLLLKVIKRICTVPKKNEVIVSDEITSFEADALRYLGGFTLKRASDKFGKNDLIAFMSSVTPQQSLIKLMEKKTGSLFCPSEEFSYFIYHVYLKTSREASKNMENMDFSALTDSILAGQYFNTFIDRMRWVTADTHDEDQPLKLMTYITTLLVRVLAKNFARKLFQRIKGKTEPLSRGLRGDLKRQVMTHE